MVGFGLLFFAAYVYLGPDLLYAIDKLFPSQSAAGAPAAQANAGRFPFPRGTGQPGVRLVIPRMHLDVPIKEATWTTSNQQGNLYTDWNIPYDAVGHLVNTAQPGEAGNMVISGHNNLVAPNVFGVGLFAGLWDLKKGDPFYVVDKAGRAFEYRVTTSYALKEEGEPQSVRTQHAQEVLKDTGQPAATLLTCWNGPVAPLSGNTYRWIVKADLVGPVDASQLAGGTPTP